MRRDGRRGVRRPFSFAALAVAAVCATSAAAAELPPGFVRLSEVAPRIRQDIRYAGADNFVGRPVAGYGAAECWLRRETAEALKAVASDLARTGWTLVVYDCYRPERAVADFVAWANDAADQHTKAAHHPAIDKDRLFALGYIAGASAHSKGVAVDVGAGTDWGAAVDFGTPFDLFDPRSATDSEAIAPQAAANRRRLVAAFAARGFRNLPAEWWHFSLARPDARAWDLPIGR